MTPSTGPDERSYRILLPPWVKTPKRTEDKDDKHEPVETISRDSVACGAMAGGYPGCDGARPSATDIPRLCEKHTSPGRSWAPSNTGSAPAGPSANTLPVPEWACACVAAVLLSEAAA